MAGEEVDDDEKVPKNKKLYNKPWYKKLVIVLAGVTNNFILGFVVLFISALIYGSFTTKPIVGVVSKDSNSYKAGIRKNDLILKINNKKIKNWDDVILTLTLEDKSKPQKIEVKRNNSVKTFNVTPKKVKDKKGNASYVYGIGLSDKKYTGVKNAFSYASSKFSSTFSSMVVTIKALFTRKIGLGALSGPVGIYSVVGTQSKAGLSGLLYLLAYLSINVGFINLLPFPAFDGYRALIIIIETITRKKVNPKVDAIVNNIGLFLLFGLMIFITIKDILRLF